MRHLALLAAITDAVSGSPATYPLVALICAGDAVLPLLPSETVLIAAATLAAQGHGLSLWLLVPAAAVGAFVGDQVSYLLGRVLGDRAAERLLRGERGRERLDWARGQVHRHGTLLVVAARFVPAGRTATTFASGTLRMPWPRFALADALGAALWAVYVCAVGAVGGATFRDQTWKALLLALGIAALVAAAIEAVRRLLKRSRAS